MMIACEAMAQDDFGMYDNYEQLPSDSTGHEMDGHKYVKSVIRSWKLTEYGASLPSVEIDTAMNFYHVYEPFYRRSFSNTYTGNLSGAYQSNDFFKRRGISDFYFYRSLDAYAVFPGEVIFFNTTTPYTLLDYSQSENKNTRSESRFNAWHSQNVTPDFNFQFVYNQGRSMGHYQHQEGRFQTVRLAGSYTSDRFNSHAVMLFNKHDTQENGGLTNANRALMEYTRPENYLVNLTDANSSLDNSTFNWTSEYKLGKMEEIETEGGKKRDRFRPITGLIYQFEYSSNKRIYTDNNSGEFYRNHYISTKTTGDTILFKRLLNLVQLKFYEAPERKFTFAARAFAGLETVSISMPNNESAWRHWKDNTANTYVPITVDPPFSVERQKADHHNAFVGGALARTEGTFWKWNAEGKIYLAGYRVGQTELTASIEKPLRLGRDTTTLRIEGELNNRVPDYFEQYFNSNHFIWNNDFDNMQEMLARGTVHSQKYKLTLGMNYALYRKYIYNDSLALPAQASREMLVLGVHVGKDIETRYLLLRANALWQSSTESAYLHLPAFTGYLSVALKLIYAKVLHINIGFDARYNTLFYADAYNPATGQFHWQDRQKVGNYPFIDAFADVRLKRARAFFILKNAGAGILGDNFWVAPDYPLYRRSFRLGVAWSFYD